MKHISLDVSEEIKNILPETLEKDLQDNEEICSVCNGLGVVLDNNVYGIKGDSSTLKCGSTMSRQMIIFQILIILWMPIKILTNMNLMKK